MFHVRRTSSPPRLTLPSHPLPLEQLWQHLPEDRQKTIGTTLAQMVAKRIEAITLSSQKKEESNE